MNMSSRLIQVVQFLLVICLIIFGVWAGIGVYSAILVYPLPQLAVARVAIVGLIVIGIFLILIPAPHFRRSLLTSIVLVIVLCGIYIRFIAFPFVYINPKLPQDSNITMEIDDFVAANPEGGGATSSVWHRSSFRWYVSRGSHDLPPLLFPIIIPVFIITINLALRYRELKKI